MTPPYAIWLLGLGAFACTLAGGLLALRLGRNIRFVTGLSAGAVIGLALFDLMPEAARLHGGAAGIEPVVLAVGIGFALYMAVQHALAGLEARPSFDHLGVASLTMHSFFDGLGIGLGFKVSSSVGVAVAAAVLAHDLCDGVNTVAVALKDPSPQARRTATRWLCANAAAPLAGIALASLAPIGRMTFAPLAAGFAGVFLYIGAVELLPSSLRSWPNPWASAPPIAGALVISAVTALIR